MEYWGAIFGYRRLTGKQISPRQCGTSGSRPYLSTPFRSGTPPPWRKSALSSERAARISACLNESLACRCSASRVTTRYSIWATSVDNSMSTDQMLTSSPQSIMSRALSFARCHVARSCCTGMSVIRSMVSSVVTDFYAPLADLIGNLFDLWPRQRSTNSAMRKCQWENLGIWKQCSHPDLQKTHDQPRSGCIVKVDCRMCRL